MISKQPVSSSSVLYHSKRERLLRLVSVLCFLSVPLTAWLILRAPRQEWENTPFGPGAWWLLPLFLLALSCAVPAAFFYLHGRYVLRLERAADGTLQLTTFLAWGRRTQALPPDYFKDAHQREEEGRFEMATSVSVCAPSLRVTPRAGRSLIFDRQGNAPKGWSVIDQLTKNSDY